MLLRETCQGQCQITSIFKAKAEENESAKEVLKNEQEVKKKKELQIMFNNLNLSVGEVQNK